MAVFGLVKGLDSVVYNLEQLSKIQSYIAKLSIYNVVLEVFVLFLSK